MGDESTFDFAAWCADFASGLKPGKTRQPMAVRAGMHEDRDTGERWATLTVTGDCSAFCVGGYAVTVECGYDITRPCPTCGPVHDHARRFNVARLPQWAHRVEPEWSGPPSAPSWAQVEAFGASLANGSAKARVWYGDPGRGKSWLACAAALCALKAGATVAWVSWPDLLSNLRDRVREGRPLRELLRPLASPALLVVDEVKGTATEFSADVAETLIGRHIESGGRILLTANLSEAQLWQCVGDRVRSRLAAAGKVSPLNGTDRRTENGR